MDDPDYTLLRPERQIGPVIFASPHSGRVYPADMLRRTRLTLDQIRSSEDAYIDDFARLSTGFGAPVLLAGVARAYLDLNRDPTELDPALIDGVPRTGHNPRIACGLGVIPRVVGQGRAIYDGKLTLDEAQARIARIWRPYHAALEQLMRDTHRRFGKAILIDLHSMPRDSLRGISPRPEIVLGDCYGRSASSEIVDAIRAAFDRAGFVTACNTPFAGVYIARTYGAPASGFHCVQVEIDRSLYLEPGEHPRRGPRLQAFSARLAPVLAQVAGMGLAQPDLAAE